MAYSGKYASGNAQKPSAPSTASGTRKKSGRKRMISVFLLLVTAMLLVCSSAATMAWLQTGNSLVNFFRSGQIDIEIQETFGKENDAYIKKNVSVKNTGGMDCYIRVLVLACRLDSNGNILTSEPAASENTSDYQITYSNSSNWHYEEEDGYFYYLLPVAEDGITDTLVESCSAQSAYFQLNIYAQAIQTAGGAPETEWGVTLDKNGTMIFS